MADKAYLVLDNGQMIEVYAKDLGEKDKGKRYLCCGKPRGVPCLAELSLVIVPEGDNYFAALSNPGHKRFCWYDKSTEFAKIAHIDPTGEGEDSQSILERFNGAENEPAHRGGMATGGGTGRGGKAGDEDEPSDETLIERIASKPRNAKELALTLLSLAEDDNYGESCVRDIFIDHRSIRGHRKKGLDDGKIAMVIASKTSKGRELRNGKNSVVLADAFYFEQRAETKLLFVVNIKDHHSKIIDAIFKAPIDKKVAVYARWHKHPEQSNVYISESVGRRCIGLLDSKYFDGMMG